MTPESGEVLLPSDSSDEVTRTVDAPPHGRARLIQVVALAIVATLALIGLGATPYLIERQSASYRAELTAVILPTEALLTRFDVSQARQVAAMRGYLLTSDTTYIDDLNAARLEEGEVLAELAALGVQIGTATASAVATVDSAASEWKVLQDRLLAGELERDAFTARLDQQQAIYVGVLGRAADLRAAVTAAGSAVRERIRTVEVSHLRLAAVSAIAALLALGALVFVTLSALRAMRALSASETELRATFEQAAVGIAHFGLDGRLQRVNRRLSEILGRAPDALKGLALSELVHADDREPELERRLQDGEIASYAREQRLVRDDGTIVWTQLTASCVRDTRGRPVHAIAIVEDISERKTLQAERNALLDAERKARGRAELEAERSQLLQAITSDLATVLDAGEAARLVIKNAVDVFGASYGFVALPTADETHLEIVGAVGLPADMARRWHRFPVATPIPLTAAYHTGQPLFGEHEKDIAGLHGGLRESLSEKGIRAFAVLPLPLGERVLGAMTLDFGEEHSFDAEERELLGSIGRQLAQALDRIRLFDAEKARRAEAEAAVARVERLQALTAALTMALTTEQVAETMARVGCNALGGHSAATALLRPGSDSLETVGWFGYPADIRADWETLPLSTNLPLPEAMRTGGAIWIGSRQEWAERFGPPPRIERLLPSGAWAAIPLSFEGRVLGGLAITFTEPREFTAEDRALGHAIAQLGAQALERAWLYDEMRSARRAAEAGVRSRDRFLATMGHEMQSPLAELIGIFDLITDERLPDPATQMIGQARSDTWRLAALVDSILAVADIEAGTARVTFEPVDVGSLVRDIATSFEPAARDRGIAFRVDIAEDTPLIDTDPRKLRPIVYHLIDNALRFTQRGEVVASVVPARGVIVVRVADTGPGIPMDRQEAIFEPFTQLDATHTRQRGGAGIGLALARRYARLLRGELTVLSQVGHGSAFSVYLPVADGGVAEAARGGAEPEPAGESAIPARVLVVDDEEAIRRVVVRTLQRRSIAATPVADAESALDRLAKETFDLVLTDISMPRHSGLWLADRVRERFPGVRVVLMSGAELTPEEIAWIGRLDCLFVSKPFEPQALGEALRREIAMGRMGQPG